MSCIDRHPANWLANLAEQIRETLSAEIHLNAYALIDCAFQTACYRRLKTDRHLRWHALFSHTPSADDETLSLSPILLALDANGRWQDVLQVTDGLPMTSWILTPESLDEFAQRLRAWCIVDADGQSLVLRFADTRRLPDMVSVLTPQQHGQMFGPATRWHYVGRNAQWKALALPEQALPPASKVRLDERQYATLIGHSEPDEIIQRWRRTQRHVLDGESHSVAHEKLANALALADRYVIQNSFEREQWCLLWFRHPALGDDARVSQLLAQVGEQTLTPTQAIASIQEMYG